MPTAILILLFAICCCVLIVQGALQCFAPARLKCIEDKLGLFRVNKDSAGGASSVITLKPAIHYQFKTGQRDWPKT
jgi:hypothetical protein